jgi:hypothetical protein
MIDVENQNKKELTGRKIYECMGINSKYD